MRGRMEWWRWRAGALVGAMASLLVSTAVRAQAAGDRPSEQDLFGGGAAPSAAAPADGGSAISATPAPPAPAPAAAAPNNSTAEGTDRDRALLGDQGEAKFLADYVAPENPLQIGGQLYLRAQTTASGHQDPGSWSLSAPSLLDVYLDARPNPRVRAFVLGRMSYDPTLPPSSGSGTTSAEMMSSGGALAGGNPTGFSSFSSTRGPNSLLDQMWIRFDILERVFVTAGKQHVRWGTGKFWQPTDYLHPQKRNPLDVFDARPGTTMLKVNVPLGEEGWNLYGFAVAEDPNNPTNSLGEVAGAFRAEAVVAGVELGADAYLRKDQPARFGFDASTGIYDFDVYADVAVRPGEDFEHYFPDQNTVGGFTGHETQAVGGISYSRKYNDNDMWTAGIEYFYNHPGYTGSSAYSAALQYAIDNPSAVPDPFALFPFFYLGRQYGSVYVSFPAPYSWNYTTFTLSTLGNFSDSSFITRLDYSVTILTHLSVEAFVGVHYGHEGGEFRFDLPPTQAAELSALAGATVLSDYPVLDLGAALRLKI